MPENAGVVSSFQNLTIVPDFDKKLTEQNEQTGTDGVQAQRNDRERVQILSEVYTMRSLLFLADKRVTSRCS